MRLLLIRHGQTPHNVIGSLDTAFPGAGLTDLGHRQAQAIPGALDGVFSTGSPADGRLAGVYASPLVRTQLTARPLSQALDLDVAVQPGLEEISAGDYELRHDEEAVLAYVTCLASWIQGDLDSSLPGGTDGHEFLGRYTEALTRIAGAHGPDDLVTVFSHGAAIRVFTSWATGLTPEQAKDLRIANTGGGLLEGDPSSGWVLRHWSSKPIGGGHLIDGAAQDVSGKATEEAKAEARAG